MSASELLMEMALDERRLISAIMEEILKERMNLESPLVLNQDEILLRISILSRNLLDTLEASHVFEQSAIVELVEGHEGEDLPRYYPPDEGG